MIEFPDSIAITADIQAAVLRYLEGLSKTPREEFHTLPMEGLRVDVGVAVLVALDLYDPPRPAVVQPAPERPRDRRPVLPFIVRAKVMARDGFQCLRCGTTENLTVDHFIPVALGGLDDLSNLRTLCNSCNAKKGARLES